ncbi:hypothetical protein PVK06_008845 [Gossypium arboreum]|uniref:Uncharacterized protein n=1 Tax=Gossypium arboreum TaxID=29729 RepID=A0ABR0QKZ8_GOSAR|nr:hypothetical protein PVK06_008845 [Gossypium arboreum]
MLANLRSINEVGATYLTNISFEKWNQSYDGSLRYRHMTMNLTKCINSIFKGKHHLPITSVVKETYFCLVAIFSKQAEKYDGNIKGDRIWSKDVMKEIRDNVE